MPSKIEWTNETWNVVTGCTKVSPGCAHCYAERDFPRVYGKDVVLLSRRDGDSRPRLFTDVRLHHDRLEQPLRWRKPRKVFVCSMGDLFHEDVPEWFINQVFAIMALCPDHTFQILTKRPNRMREYINFEDRVPAIAECIEVHRVWRKLTRLPVGDIRWPMRNVWLGVSVEDQKHIRRLSILRDTPAAVRFVSFEPLLSGIEIDEHAWAALDWVITGGESGPKARPMHLEWLRSLRNQCVITGVPFFFKQWGEWEPLVYRSVDGVQLISLSLGRKEVLLHDPYRINMKRVGKKAAGRMLDGREWSEYPE